MDLRRATSLAALVGLSLVGMAHGRPAGQARRRCRAEERRPDRRRLADLRTDPGGNALQPAQRHQRRNVTRLGLAWSYDLGSGGGGQEATPLVWNGTLYGITNWSVVFAVDARTGKEKWRWDP